MNANEREEALQRAYRILGEVPLIDGHNDLPFAIRKYFKGKLNDVDLSGDQGPVLPLMTDMRRIRNGRVGGQFWVSYAAPKTQHRDGVRIALEQIDMIHRIVARYSDTLELVNSADGIWDAFKRGKVASLIGVEGGHLFDSSLGALRCFYQLGVRYVTLTHNGTTPFAECCLADQDKVQALEDPGHGLSDYGVRVIHEMNRLGMMVDLSHTSKRTQQRVLEVSKAPVIYSHSSAYALCAHVRNVHDDLIVRVRENEGIIMVNGNPPFVDASANGTVQKIAEHAEYIRKLAGDDYVGIGGDFDGITSVSSGFEDVSKYPDLLVELIRLGWSDEQLRKFAGLNLIRVMRAVERVRDQLQTEQADESEVPEEDLEKHLAEIDRCANCYKQKNADQ